MVLQQASPVDPVIGICNRYLQAGSATDASIQVKTHPVLRQPSPRAFGGNQLTDSNKTRYAEPH